MGRDNRQVGPAMMHRAMFSLFSVRVIKPNEAERYAGPETRIPWQLDCCAKRAFLSNPFGCIEQSRQLDALKRSSSFSGEDIWLI